MNAAPSLAPAKIFRDMLSVARFEALRSIGSLRGFLVLFLYLAASGLTGTFYVTAVRALEEKAVDLVTQQNGATGARESVDITKVDAYQKLVESFAGDDSAKAELWKTTPPIVLVSFFFALSFLPFLVMLSAHDALAKDNELRTLRYVRPRLSMTAWVVGKFIAQSLLIFAVTVASGLLIYAIAVSRLEMFDAASGALAFATFWWRVLVFELAILGILFLISAISRTAFTALVFSAFALFALWLMQFFSWLKSGDELSPWGYIAYGTPFTYKDGLWHPPSQSLAVSAAALVGFAILSIALSIYALDERDL
jgi:ABC-2 family transporter protein